MAEKDRASGLKEAANRVWASFMEGVTLRLELLEAEFQEERRRLVSMVVASGVAVFFAVMTFLSLNLLLLVSFWDRRILVALCLAGGYLLAALVAFLIVRRSARRSAPPFSASRRVLEQDRSHFGRGPE